MIKTYFKVYWRSALRNKWIYLLNILGLALGIAAVILLLFYVHHEYSFDRFHKDHKLTYRANVSMMNGEDDIDFAFTRMQHAGYVGDRLPSISSTCRIRPSFGLSGLTYNENSYNCRGYYVDDNFFQFFSFKLLEGDVSSLFNDLHSIVISQQMKNKIFGDQPAIGEILELGTYQMQVKGVYEDIPDNSHIQSDYFFPLDLMISEMENEWQGFSFITYLKFHDGQNTAENIQKAETLLTEEVVSTGNVEEGTLRTYLQQLPEIHMNSGHMAYATFLQRPGDKRYVYVFWALAIFIIVIAMVNFINLSTAFGERRSREIGIRKSLGESTKGLRKQFIFETILSSILSLFIALTLAFMVIKPFEQLMNRHFVIDTPLLLTYLPIVFLICLLLGLIAGLYPAYVASNFSVLKCLKGGRVSNSKGNYFQKSLVVLQFFIAAFLISCLTVVVLQVNYMLNKNLGYNTNQVVVFKNMGEKIALNEDELRNRIVALPAVEELTTSINSPGSPLDIEYVYKERGNQETKMYSSVMRVKEDFFDFYRYEFIEGSTFPKPKAENWSLEHAVVNEEFAKQMGLQAPYVGKHFYYEGNKIAVLGVLKDFHFKSLHSTIDPIFIIPHPYADNLSVRLNTVNPAQGIDQVLSVIGGMNEDYIPDYRILNQALEVDYAEDQRRNTLLLVTAIMGVLISIMGLYALTSFTLKKRQKEVGIRKVLGASLLSINRGLMGDLLKWVLIANVLAIPLAYWAMNIWLQNFAYHITLKVWMFGLSALFTMLIAFITILQQTLVLSIQNPVDVIRTDG